MFLIQLVTNSLSSAPENLADCHLLYQDFILDAPLYLECSSPSILL